MNKRNKQESDIVALLKRYWQLGALIIAVSGFSYKVGVEIERIRKNQEILQIREDHLKILLESSKTGNAVQTPPTIIINLNDSTSWKKER